MPPLENSDSDSGSRWSDRMAERFGLVIPPDLADWLNDERLRQGSDGASALRYHQAVDLDDLVSPAPRAVWPVLMPCDFLPILGNDSGDWLCARVGTDDHIIEWVQWYHGGGDWIPWGSSLSHAMIFDAVEPFLPGPKRDHAVHPEDIARGELTEDPQFQWAVRQSGLDSESVEVMRTANSQSADVVAQVMIENGIAEVAVRCQMVLTNLPERLIEQAIAQVSASDEDDRMELSDADRQRVETARQHSRIVSESAPHLAWAWDLLGICELLLREDSNARSAFEQGLHRSLFTDQSVRMGTHQHIDEAMKFSARMLIAMKSGLDENSYLQHFSNATVNQRRDAVTDHWTKVCHEAEASDDFSLATQAAIAGGWDIGAEPMSEYVDRLRDIQRLSKLAGHTALSRVVQTHLACFLGRYSR